MSRRILVGFDFPEDINLLMTPLVVDESVHPFTKKDEYPLPASGVYRLYYDEDLFEWVIADWNDPETLENWTKR